MKGRILAAALVAAAVLALSACGGSKKSSVTETKTQAAAETTTAAAETMQTTQGEELSDKDTLIVALDREPASLDPNGNNVVVKRMADNCIYDTLLKFDSDLTPSASLAKEWEQVDELTWKFMLRDDVMFHDGTPLTSGDVIYSFKRIADSGSGNDLTAPFDPEGYEMPDDHTLIIRTKEPYAFMEAALCSPGLAVVPQKAVEKMGDDAFARNPVGSGPYKFVSWTAGDSIVIERNDDYWGDKSILKTITFRIITESSSRTIDLESGGVDLVLALPTTDAERIADNPDTQLILNMGAYDRYLAMNCQTDVFKDVRVRRALNYATDSETIRTICYGVDTSEPMLSVVPNTLRGYREDLPQYEYDIDMAKALLKEAGYENGMTVSFSYLSSSTLNMLAGLLQQMWAEIGVTLELKPTESGALTSALNKGDFELACVGTNFPLMEAGDQLYNMFHTSKMYSGSSRSKLSDPEVDAMLEKIVMTTDADMRTGMVEELSAKLHDLSPIIYIGYTKNVLGASSKLRGFMTTPTALYDFRTIYFVK